MSEWRYIYIGSDLESEKQFVWKRVQKVKKAFMSQGIGTRGVRTSPLAMTKLYWTICIPRMTHGLEVLPPNKNSVEIMEQAHESMVKMRGLPPQTANEACLAPLGWWCLSTHFDYLKLLFLWRILLFLSRLYTNEWQWWGCAVIGIAQMTLNIWVHWSKLLVCSSSMENLT